MTRRFPLEIAAVWTLFAVVTAEILVTYSRLPAHDLYHVSGSGLRGGASRALVFLNYPLALVAIAVAAFLYPYLTTSRERVVASIGVVLAAAIFWPGIVDQADLDARWVNVVPALGVLTALGLTIAAARRLRPSRPAARHAWDRLRVLVAAAALVLAVPWLVADLGFSFGGVPVLGTLYQSGELRTQPHVPEPHPAVHHGHHHGMDGVLLVLTALLLSRLLGDVRSTPLRLGLGAYLALMLCYGAGNIANDFWLEQVVKRGWTDWEIPDVTTPAVSRGWAVIVLAAAVVWTIGVRSSRRPSGGSVLPDVETA